MLQSGQGNFCGIKKNRIRPETYGCTGILFADLAHLVQAGHLLTVLERQVVFLAITAYPQFQVFRQRIHHGYTNTVQTAREAVVFIRKFSTGMQAGKNNFGARHTFFRMYIYRHATTVIPHLYGTILEHRHFDLAGKPGCCFVNAIIDHFLNKMIWPGSIGIHARTLAYRVQAAQNLNRGGIISTDHLTYSSSLKRKLSGLGVRRRRSMAAGLPGGGAGQIK